MICIPRPRAVLVVLLLTAVPFSARAADLPGPPVAEIPSWLGDLWEGLVGLFAPLGSETDPSGREVPSGTCDPTELGSTMDPNGREVPDDTTELGPSMDPDG